MPLLSADNFCRVTARIGDLRTKHRPPGFGPNASLWHRSIFCCPIIIKPKKKIGPSVDSSFMSPLPTFVRRPLGVSIHNLVFQGRLRLRLTWIWFAFHFVGTFFFFSVHENRVLMFIFPNDAHRSHHRKKLFCDFSTSRLTAWGPEPVDPGSGINPRYSK
jgi:hypothetical protein